MLHTINGFLCAAIGFSLLDLLNENSKNINLSPLYLSIFSFCFSMTIGITWEFFELTTDKLLLTDMQKDTIVTSISTVNLDETNSNKSITIKNIDKTILLDSSGNELAVINGGYLDVGLYDTMQDLFVNLIGAVVFSFFGYFYITNKNKYTFINNFIPKKKT